MTRASGKRATLPVGFDPRETVDYADVVREIGRRPRIDRALRAVRERALRALGYQDLGGEG